jgi:hypothetical protein
MSWLKIGLLVAFLSGVLVGMFFNHMVVIRDDGTICAEVR